MKTQTEHFKIVKISMKSSKNWMTYRKMEKYLDQYEKFLKYSNCCVTTLQLSMTKKKEFVTNMNTTHINPKQIHVGTSPPACVVRQTSLANPL